MMVDRALFSKVRHGILSSCCYCPLLSGYLTPLNRQFSSMIWVQRSLLCGGSNRSVVHTCQPQSNWEIKIATCLTVGEKAYSSSNGYQPALFSRPPFRNVEAASDVMHSTAPCRAFLQLSLQPEHCTSGPLSSSPGYLNLSPYTASSLLLFLSSLPFFFGF